MKIYLFDFDTRELIGEDQAQSCQLNEQDFILPANTTKIKPPKLKTKQMAVFDLLNQQWIIKKDIRGTYWNKATKEQVEVSDIMHNLYNLTDKQPMDDEWCCWSEERQTWFIDLESKKQNELDNKISEAKQCIAANEFRWTNQVRWNQYSDEEKQKVSDYYNALLNVINQAERGILVDLPIWGAS